MGKHERKKQVIEEAARLFSSRRFDEVLMDDIAQQAGVGKLRGQAFQGGFYRRRWLLDHPGRVPPDAGHHAAGAGPTQVEDGP
ncbi:TetR/AcrR family transcriptional regulator, partial [bacterium]|nr:TetR/AcrR family transcriptional regulator [bacterium]